MPVGTPLRSVRLAWRLIRRRRTNNATRTARRAVPTGALFHIRALSKFARTDTSGAKDAKIASRTVNEVHLCCGKCVKAVNAALGEVKGITSNTAEKGAKSFEIKGEFNAKEVFAALQKAGLTGKAVN